MPRVRAGSRSGDLVRGAAGIYHLVFALVPWVDEHMTQDELEFAQWKAERDKARRKAGAYWLTTEGRDAIRDVFPDHDDGNCVRPLLDYMERLEKRLADLESNR